MTMYRAPERRAGLRRRHHPVGVGAGQPATTGARRPPTPRPSRRPSTCSPTWGCSPTTLQTGLTAATASTDTTAPTSTITAPAAGATVPVGARRHGHRDRGRHRRRARRRRRGLHRQRRHVAPGHRPRRRGPTRSRPTPSGAARPSGPGPPTTAANIETPGAGVTITVGTARRPRCPCSIWPRHRHAGSAPTPTPSAVELGVKFRTGTDGFITGIRFYKATAEHRHPRRQPVVGTGTQLGHGHLHRRDAPAAGSRPTSPRPVAGHGQHHLRGVVLHPDRRYSVSSRYFATSRRDARAADGPARRRRRRQRRLPLRADRRAAFPTSTFQSENYWVDVVFTDADTDTTADGDGADARGRRDRGRRGVAVTATFSEAVSSRRSPFELRDPGGAVGAGTTSLRRGDPHRDVHPAARDAAATTYTVNLSAGPATPPATRWRR